MSTDELVAGPDSPGEKANAEKAKIERDAIEQAGEKTQPRQPDAVEKAALEATSKKPGLGTRLKNAITGDGA